jgi:hypothetical protein
MMPLPDLVNALREQRLVSVCVKRDAADVLAALQSLDDLRPACPTCHGPGVVDGGSRGSGHHRTGWTGGPCPAGCDGGKVPWREWLRQVAVLWRGVHNYDTNVIEPNDFVRGWISCIHHLRNEPPR